MAKDAEIRLVLNTAPAMQEARQFGKELEKSLNIQSEIPAIKKYQGIITDSLQKISRISDKTGKMTGGFNTSKLERYEKELEPIVETAKELESVNKQIAEKQAILPSLRGKIGGAKTPEAKETAKANYAGTKAEIDELIQKQTILATQLNGQWDTFEKIKKAVDEVNSFETDHKDKVSAINTTYDELVAKTRETATNEQETADSAKVAADSTDAIETAAKGAAAATDNLANKMQEAANPENSSENQMIKNAVQTTASLKDLITAFLQAKSNLADFQRAGKDTAETEQTIADLAEQIRAKLHFEESATDIGSLAEHLQELADAQKLLEKSRTTKDFSPEYSAIIKDIELTKLAIHDYKKQIRDAAKPHKEVEQAATSMSNTVQKEFAKAKTASDSLGNSTKKIAQKTKSGTSEMANLAKTVKDGFKGLDKIANNVKRAFSGMASSMRSNFKHMITSITKYVLGFRSLFFLVRRLRKYIGEGIKNMAQFNSGSNHVNASITRLLSSLLYLKNAWATAFSPILQFVTPWLEALIDKLAEAGNAFSRFLGSLLGQTTVFQAVKVKAADYADSLDNVGGSAGGAADKTKKLTDRLAAFDDLNVLGVDKDPDKNRGGGGGGYNNQYEPNPNDMFKLVTVADEIKRKFQEMWALADFSELGASLAQKLKDMLENLLEKFPEIKESAHRLGESIGTFITGFFRDTSLFNDAGTAVAESLNTLTEFITGFFDGYQAGKIGAEIASFFRGIFENFNWKEAGEALGALVDGLFKELNALVSGFPTEVVAKGISDFIKGVIDTIEWSTVGELLSSALIGIFDIATVLSENLSTDEIQTALEDFLSTIKWNELFTAIGKSINASADATIAISDAITSAVLNSLDDPNTVFSISKGVGSFLSNLNITEVFSGVAEFLGKVIYETSKPSFLLSLLGGFVVGLSEALADSLTATAEKSGIENWWEKPGWALVEGLAKGIDEAIINIFNAVTSPFIAIEDGFCELFGIHSPSTVAEGWGINIIEGLVNGIISLIDTVMEPFNKLKEDLDGKWSEIKTSASEKWTDIKNKLAEKATDIKSKLSEVWTNIRGDAYTAWVMLRISAVQAFTQLKDALKSPINGVIAVVESMINKIIGGINNVVSKINTIPDIKFTNPFTGTEYKLGFSIPKLSSISIPRLAQGAVIPPNREFMAVLGDQSHGTNIEAPLDTIKQAVAEVINSGGYAEMIQLLQELITVVQNKNLVIGDKEIGKANARYVNQQRMIRGTNF